MYIESYKQLVRATCKLINNFFVKKLYAIRYTLYANSQSGVVVIFSVLLIGIILSIVFSLSLIFIPKIKSASDVKNSVAAAYAAESAIEWCLYVNRIGVVSLPLMSNGATLINGTTNLPFVAADCAASPIRALGTYQGVTRSFEISF